MRTIHLLIIACTVLIISFVTSLVMASNIIDGEILTAITDKKTYHYGETITLEVSDFNSGPKKEISDIKSTYAGDKGPCGISYFDFVFLRGDHTDIQNYDQLAAAKNYTLNIRYPSPFDVISCPYYHSEINHVAMEPFSSHGMVYYSDPGSPEKFEMDFQYVYNIDKMYSKGPVYKQTTPDTTQEYMEEQKIPCGKYTIIAFDLSGKISKPDMIEVYCP